MTDKQKSDFIHACFLFAKRVLNMGQDGENEFIEFVSKQILREKDEAVKNEWMDMIHILINTWCLDNKDLISK